MLKKAFAPFAFHKAMQFFSFSRIGKIIRKTHCRLWTGFIKGEMGMKATTR